LFELNELKIEIIGALLIILLVNEPYTLDHFAMLIISFEILKDLLMFLH